MKKYFFTAMLVLSTAVNFAQDPPLSSMERTSNIYLREEEKLARDVYDSLFRKWNTNPFSNIRRSEQVHMDRMKTLLTGYQLEDPVVKTKDRAGYCRHGKRDHNNQTPGHHQHISIFKDGFRKSPAGVLPPYADVRSTI